jgi:nucleoside-diphosphate-sugar epimerase
LTALVTGAAGFIGSHLCELLLAEGEEVRGVDCFTDYYPRERKLANLERALAQKRFSLHEVDLAAAPPAPLLDDVEIVYHLAAQPGVRASWGREFEVYVRNNVLATQRLLEACRERPPAKLVFASSSSIYGDAPSYPTTESTTPNPVSPYGVTKLAAEHLCGVYRANFGLPTAALRLFTVYGPRQRPDMAFARLTELAVARGSFELYGDGEQTRDFTYVGDVVRAMRDAARSEWLGVANVGGGMRVSMNEVIERLSELCGPIEIDRKPPSAGDVRDTGADTSVAAAGFGYRPRTTLEEGLRAMVEWQSGREAVRR